MKRPGLAALLVLAIALLASLIMGVAFLVSPTDGQKPAPIVRPEPPNRPLIRVEGSQDITEHQVWLLQRLQELRRGFQKPGWSLIQDLLHRAAGEEILRRHGQGIQPDESARERVKYFKESQDRESLQRIADLLDPYPGMFDLVYVRPVMVNQRLQRLHATDRAIHKDSLAKAEAGLKEAQSNPDWFRVRAADPEGGYQRIDTRTVGIPGDIPDGPQEGRRRVQESFRNWAKANLSRLGPGDLGPDLIDEPNAFTVVRLLERDGEDAVYEMVGFLKIGFPEWYEAEIMKVKVEILDRKTEEDLRSNLKETIWRWLFAGR